MPLNDLDKALILAPNRFSRFTSMDNAFNQAQREQALADGTIQPEDTSELEIEESLGRIFDFIEKEGKDQNSPLSQVRAESAKPKPKGYFAETVLPDALRFVTEQINDGITAVYMMTGLPLIPAPPGQEEDAKFIPRINVNTQEGQGVTGLSMGKTSLDEQVEQTKETVSGLADVGNALVSDFSGTIKALSQFAEDAPVSTAMLAFPLIVGGTAKLQSLRRIRSILPNSIHDFVEEAGAVMKGSKNYAHVHVSANHENYDEVVKVLGQMRKRAEKAGKGFEIVKSLDPDEPGLNMAIFNKDKVKEALEGFGERAGGKNSVRKFVREGLKGPERYETDYYKGLIDPLRHGNTVVVREVPGRAKMKWGDSLLRSPQRVLARVHPVTGKIARRARELLSEQKIDTETFRLVRDDFYDPIEAKMGKDGFGKILADLDRKAADNPDFDLDAELMKLPEDVRPGVRRHKELMDHLKDLITEERVASGVPRELAEEWSKTGFYFTKLFKGNFEIHGKPSGGGSVRQLDRAVSEGEAYRKLQSLGKSGASDLHIKFDNVIPAEVMGRLPRKKLMQLFNTMSKNAQVDIDMMMEFAKKNGIPVVGPTESKKKYLRYANRRQTVDGQEFEFTNFDYRAVTDAYLSATSRYLAMNKWQRDYLRLKGQVPQSMTKVHNYLERYNEGIQGHRFATSENFDGLMQSIAGTLNKGLSKAGVDFQFDPQPYAMERLLGTIRSVQANVKLGTPRAMVVNALQTAQTLYPRVGERVFWRAWKDSFKDDVIQRAMDAGVGHMRTKVDLGNLSARSKAGVGTSIKESKFLYGFTKAELKNRVVAFRAGEIEAQSAKGRYVARKLGMDPKDPDFIKQYAVDMVSRTQFDLSPADMPRWLQHPIAQTLLQFKPFQLKYIEAIADLRNQPDKLAAFGRFAGALTAAGGAKSLTSPVTLATTYGMWEVYKEVRDHAGEETANLMMYGVPGMIGMDLTNSLNIDLVPTFGNTPEEKIVNFLGGPTLADVIDLVRFSGLKEKDQEAVLAYLKKMVPQVKWGFNIWHQIQEDRWLRSNRGDRIARADAVDRWLESLSFSTVNRSLANVAQYEIEDDRLSRSIDRFARQGSK